MSGSRPWVLCALAVLAAGAFVGLELALGRPGNGPRFEGQAGFYALASAGLCLVLAGVSLLARLILGRADDGRSPGDRAP